MLKKNNAVLEKKEVSKNKKPSAKNYVLGFIFLVILYLTSLYSYILFHSVAELFSIVVAFSVFVVAWNANKIIQNNYLRFLGISYLVVASIDLLHTLAYKGMGVFTGFDTNLPTQLWIAGRYVNSLSLLVATFFIRRNFKTRLVFLSYFMIFAAIFSSIFYWKVFPDCFIEGIGLTTFKIVSEYIISAILLIAIVILWRKRTLLNELLVKFLVAAMGVTILSEMAFTLYTDPYGFSNMLGHFLKLIAYYLVYKGIIETGLVQPYSVLFKDLKENEERLAVTLASIGDGVIATDTAGTVIMLNKIAEKLTGWSNEEAIGNHIENIFKMVDEEKNRELSNPVEEVIQSNKSANIMSEAMLIPKDGSARYITSSCAAIHDDKGQILGAVLVFKDITEKKLAEKKQRELDERIKLLLESTDQGLYGVDLNGNCTFINKAALEMLGYSYDEIIGKNAHQLIHYRRIDGTDYDVHDCPLYKTIIEGQGSRSDDEILWRKNGESFMVEYSSYPVVEEGKITGGVVVFSDITERKLSERLLEAYNEIITAINSTLNLNDVIDSIIIKATQAIGAEAAGIVMRNKNNSGWTMNHIYGFPIELAGRELTSEEARATEIAVKTRKPVISSDALNDPRFNRKIIEEFGIKSLIAIPLIVKDEVIGVINFDYRSNPVAFSDSQIDFANKLALSVSVALENSRLYEAEHKIADTLQTAILTVPHEIAGLEISYKYKSATEIAKIGGDFYDFFELGDGFVGFLIGDVSGKGLGAAAITYMVKSVIRAFAHRNIEPSVVLEETNNAVEKQLTEGQFVTAIFGVIDIETGKAKIASAGHPDPVLCKPTGCEILLAKRNHPLGILPNSTYDSFEVELNKNDTLLLYTDGLLEARHDSELFGEDRILKTLEINMNHSTSEMVEFLLNTAEAYAKNLLTDDIAIVAIKYSKEKVNKNPSPDDSTRMKDLVDC